MTEREGSDTPGSTALDRVLVSSTGTEDRAGVYGYAFDAATGAFEELASTAVRSPGYHAVSADGTRAYVTNSAGDGRVVAMALERESGTTTVLDERASGGTGPCFISLDAAERFAFVANYSGGSVAMLPVDDDGRLEGPCDVVAHEGSSVRPDRQAAPHPHAVVPGPDDQLLYVPDLGTDRVEAYDIVVDDASGTERSGRLRPNDAASVALPPGTGPRQLAFGPDGEHGYLVGELDSTVTALARDSGTGELEAVSSVKTVPQRAESENKPSAVVVHPCGEWCYVSNRGHQSIVTVGVDGGALDVRGYTPTGGETPRDITLAPGGEYLLVENKDSDEVATFAVGEGGDLSELGRADVLSPKCLAFVPQRD
jgi:6-phosphogluconolactonase